MSKKIYIDPGHSNVDPGAVSYEVERDLNEKVAKFMNEHLIANYICETKVDPITNNSLAAITNAANAWGAHLLVSIHFNAGRGDGYEALIYSEKTRELGKIFEKHVLAIGQNSRGVKLRPGLVVLKTSNMPAILNEGAFVDNKKDIEDWNDDAELKKMGIAYAEAAAEYLKLEKKVVAPAPVQTPAQAPEKPVEKSEVDKLLEVALGEVGYLEKRSNSSLYDDTANAGYNNYTKYAKELDALGNFYNGPKNGYAWCDVFVDWCFVTAFGVERALDLLEQPKKSCGAGCGYSANYYKSNGQFHSIPEPGDQIFFYNSSLSGMAHTGLVYAVDSNYVYTVEGNTSGDSGVIDNGGGVFKKKYERNFKRIAGYGRPDYKGKATISAPTSGPSSSTSSTYAPTVKEWQLAAIADGYKFPQYGADGDWGNECIVVAKKAIVKKRATYMNKNLTKIVQKVVGVNADGECGPATDSAIRKYQSANGLTPDGEVGLNTWKKMLKV